MSVYRLTPQVAALTTLITTRWGPASNESRLAHQLGDALPRVLRVLWCDTPDGYPTSTPGARDRDGSAGTGTPDKLGNLVTQREQPTATYAALCARISDATLGVALRDRTTVTRALNASLRICDGCHEQLNPQAYKAIKKAMSCCHKQPNDDGTAPWVDPLCANIADQGRQGMCEACYRRRLRYMQREAEQQAS